MKKRILLPLILLASFSMTAALTTACTKKAEKGEDGYGVEITNKDELLEEWFAGTSRTLAINLTPAGNVALAINKGELKITSSNEAVASVTGQSVNALAEGTATIEAKYHGWKDSIELTFARKQTNKEKYGTTHEGDATDPFDNEDAVKVAKWAKDNGNTEPLYVKGTVSYFYHAPGSRTDGGVSWFLEPAAGQTESFEVYKCYKAEGTGSAKYLTYSDVWKGGEAIAYGPITWYADGSQAEFTGSTFVSCTGTAPGPQTTVESTFAEVLAMGKELHDGESSYDYYQFDAYVTAKEGNDYFLTATKAEAISDKKTNTIELYGATADGLADKLLKNAKVTAKIIVKNYHGQIESGTALAATDITVKEAGEAWEVTTLTTMQDIYESGKAGDSIDIKGVYVGNYGNKNNEWFIANGDYGLYLYQITVPTGLVVGESVHVTGKLSVYKGLIQVDKTGVSVEEISDVITYNELSYTGQAFSKALLSRPVQLTGTVKEGKSIDGNSNVSVTVTVGTKDVTIYVKKSYGLDYTALNTALGTAGNSVTLKGYVAIFDGASTVDYATSTGYQVVSPVVVA